MLPPAAAGRLSGSGCVPSGLAPAGWPSFGPPPHHSAAALSRSFLGRCCPFVGCGFAANARAALPAALVLAGSCCVLGSGFFLFARAGQRQRAKKKNENISPAQNLGAKEKIRSAHLSNTLPPSREINVQSKQKSVKLRQVSNPATPAPLPCAAYGGSSDSVILWFLVGLFFLGGWV